MMIMIGKSVEIDVFNTFQRAGCLPENDVLERNSSSSRSNLDLDLGIYHDYRYL